MNAKKFLPHIKPGQFPAQALACALYLEGGIRGVEIGTLMFDQAARMDLVRLAIPRRVYPQSHIDYVVEVILEVWRRRGASVALPLTVGDRAVGTLVLVAGDRGFAASSLAALDTVAGLVSLVVAGALSRVSV